MAATAHQIARTATLFGVSEIIVYDTAEAVSKEEAVDTQPEKPKKIVFGAEEEKDKDTKGCVKQEEEVLTDQDKLIGYLKYFVTPSYLRKSLFGDKLHFFEGAARKLPKLTGVPFLNHSSSRYFVGLTVKRRIPGTKQRKIVSANGRKRKRKSKSKGEEAEDPNTTGYVNIGFKKVMKLSGETKVPVNTVVVVDKETCTVVSQEEAFGPKAMSKKEDKESEIETSSGEWTKLGYAYSVRKVNNFGKVFTECPYPSGYRYTALAPCLEYFCNATGTSMDGEDKAKKGCELWDIPLIEEETFLINGIPLAPGEDISILMVLGKWSELEEAILNDKHELAGIEKARMIFDGRLRMGRGSRVEDALTMALSKIEGL